MSRVPALSRIKYIVRRQMSKLGGIQHARYMPWKGINAKAAMFSQLDIVRTIDHFLKLGIVIWV